MTGFLDLLCLILGIMFGPFGLLMLGTGLGRNNYTPRAPHITAAREVRRKARRALVRRALGRA